MRQRDLYRDAYNRLESYWDKEGYFNCNYEGRNLCYNYPKPITGRMTQREFYEKYGYDYSVGATESNEMMYYCILPDTFMPCDGLPYNN